MEKLNSSKVIATITTVFLLASLFWLLSSRRSAASLESELQKEKLEAETLLSEKLLAEKELARLKEQTIELTGKKQDLELQLQSVSASLEKRDADFSRMTRENRSLAQLRKERAELVAMQNQLQNDLQASRASYDGLKKENEELNSTVALLQERNRLLSEDLNRSLLSAIDQSLINATKRNDGKLTIKANRTKKIAASFDVPANFNNLNYRIVDSNGNVLSANDGTITSKTTPSDKNLVASSTPSAEGSKLQKAEMVFIPTKKLKTGVYRVEVSNDNLYVGSLNVKLK